MLVTPDGSYRFEAVKG